jgi:hypothetical protein
LIIFCKRVGYHSEPPCIELIENNYHYRVTYSNDNDNYSQ